MQQLSIKPLRLASAILAIATGAITPSLAHANSPAAQFVSESGYEAVNADTVWQEINNALRAQASSLFQPAAELGPIPLSVQALDALEPALERTRYRVRYGVDWVAPNEQTDSAGGQPVPVSYIEVTRFNLGPALREDLIKSLGQANVADEQAFGVGPHTSWRFVTRPIMGNRAMIVSAGRTEIDDKAARNEMCLGSPCLDIASVINGAAPWSEMQAVEPRPSSPLAGSPQLMTSPAAAINQLLGDVDSIEVDRPAGAPSRPDWSIEAVIESNLGQDIGTDAAYRWGNLLDDSIGTLWQRLSTIGMGAEQPTVFRAEAFECIRGPAFAAPGEFCP